MSSPSHLAPSPTSAAPLSKKAQKRLRDRGFNEKFSISASEKLWEKDHARCSHAAFRRRTGVPPPVSAAGQQGDLHWLRASLLTEMDRCGEYARLRKALAQLCGDRYPSMAFE